MARTKKAKNVQLEEKPVNGTSLVKAIDNIAEYSDFNDKGIIGKCDGVFPLTSATANNIYFLPSNGKYYKCKTNYNGNQLTIPNDNFIDMSVLQNSDRLDNLKRYEQILFLNDNEIGKVILEKISRLVILNFYFFTNVKIDAGIRFSINYPLEFKKNLFNYSFENTSLSATINRISGSDELIPIAINTSGFKILKAFTPYPNAFFGSTLYFSS